MNKEIKAYRELYDDAVDVVAGEVGDPDSFRERSAEWKAWACRYDTQHPLDMNPSRLKNFLRGKKDKKSWLLDLWLILDTFCSGAGGPEFDELNMVVLDMLIDARNGKVMSNDYPEVELPPAAPVVYKDFVLRNPELLFRRVPPPSIIDDPEGIARTNPYNIKAEERHDHPRTREFLYWANEYRATIPGRARETVDEVLDAWLDYCNNRRYQQDPMALWEYRFVEWLIDADRETAVRSFTVMYSFIEFLAEKDVDLADQMLRAMQNFKDADSSGINKNWPDLTDARDVSLRLVKAHTGFGVRRLSKLKWEELEDLGEPQDSRYWTWKRIARHASPWVFPKIVNGVIQQEGLKRQTVNYIVRGVYNPEAGGPKTGALPARYWQKREWRQKGSHR